MEYDEKEVLAAAARVRGNAYAPYSNFLVGAAVRVPSGEIFTGCNVENISLGLTLCAERNAMASAVAAGHREFLAVAIMADTDEPISPCGACRQVIAEFSADCPVVLATISGKVLRYGLSELLPRARTGILNQ